LHEALQLDGLAARHPAARRARAGPAAGVDLSVAAGEALAVIGPSGAGKTTLLQVLACALRPSRRHAAAGRAGPLDAAAARLQRLRGQLFMAPQVPPLPPRQRVVTAVLAGRCRPWAWRQPALAVLPGRHPGRARGADRFDLADKLFERVDRLSGGERQRVGLARALLAPARCGWSTSRCRRSTRHAPRQAIGPPWSHERASAASPWWPRCTRWRWPGAFPAHRGLRDGRVCVRPAAAEVRRRPCWSTCTPSTSTNCWPAGDAVGDAHPPPRRRWSCTAAEAAA
jgi:phosphonate transport system ATP-binding protein